MQVTVLAFATAADALGTRRLTVELAEGASVIDLRHELERRRPGLTDLWERLALAVDGELASLDTRLADGAEVALLPPVSGGSPARVRLVHQAIAVADLLTARADSRHGATVAFTGSVRGQRGERPVTHLTYEGYAPMAERRLARICGEIEAARPGLLLAVTHRLGEVAVGEISVAIVARAPHRAAAFDACRELLERLKREVPIWKREHYADGSAEWREEERLVARATAPAQ